MNGRVINWLWSNNRRSENNSGSWWQLEKTLHTNVLELLTVSIEIKDFKLSYFCLLLETDAPTRFPINKWRFPCKHKLNVLTTLQELCLQINLRIRAFRIPSHLNVIADSLCWGKAIAQEMSLKATTFQLMQRWAEQLEIDMMTSPKNRKTNKFIRPPHHPDYVISCLNSEPSRSRTG